MRECSGPGFWVPGSSVCRPHHPLGLRRHGIQLMQGESPDAGAARGPLGRSPRRELRPLVTPEHTGVWGVWPVAAADRGHGLRWRVSVLRLPGHHGREANGHQAFTSQRCPGWKSKVAAGWCLARAAFWLLEGCLPALSSHVPAGSSGVCVWGVSFTRVLILLTWALSP